MDEDKFHLSGLGSVTVKKIGGRGVLQGVTYRLAGEDCSVYEKTTGEDVTLDMPVAGFFGRWKGVAGIVVSAVIGIVLIVFLTKRRKSFY